MSKKIESAVFATLAMITLSSAAMADPQVAMSTTRMVTTTTTNNLQGRAIYVRTPDAFTEQTQARYGFAHPRQAMLRDMHKYAVPVPRKELY